MKTKLLKTFLPTLLGIVTVLGLLLVFNLIVYKGTVFTQPDNGFLKYFVPTATSIALIIQYTITLPVWERLKIKKKIFGLNSIQFTALVSIISGLAFGLVFWETHEISELLFVTLTGIIAFSVYWTSNLLTLKKLDNIK